MEKIAYARRRAECHPKRMQDFIHLIDRGRISVGKAVIISKDDLTWFRRLIRRPLRH